MMVERPSFFVVEKLIYLWYNINMDFHEAIEIYNKYFDKSYLSQEEEKELLDAILDLIEITKDPYFMTYYGGYFYEKRDFETAKKYYEMAAEFEYAPAYMCLGYIYYYGRVGEPDYKKAFKYYKKASLAGSDEATYKLADMYKNGYGVEQSYDKFVEMIESLYDKYNHFKLAPEARVGVLTRMARIRKGQGNTEEAIKIFLYAKDIIVNERLPVNPFFGDINVVKWITQDIYSMKEFDYNNFDLIDIFYLVDKANTISFDYKDVQITIQIKHDGEVHKIEYLGREYPSYENFLGKATIDNDTFAARTRSFKNFKVIN